ncbi:RlpA-like double-psi beta-barrel-protein domain-containing protein-containing protein [Mrakia frigida]|uniref:RlpA-like double-psi beta-barrel-protein domain-containing protein-containing protein n=1 Tax=Mrakia frigida TaxID=29902 RepID=UPI003FCBEF10
MVAPFLLLFLFGSLSLLDLVSAQGPNYTFPKSGFASTTYYSLGLDTIAACGCKPLSTHYPTAALSRSAYGSPASYGPACGLCFNITLLNTFLSNPPFYPEVKPWVVLKITDSCPTGSDWCGATSTKGNSAGHYINFDLAQPSIPASFYPSNATLYGYTDFGIWNASYSVVNCEYWAGFNQSDALGEVLNSGGCCPADPLVNGSCPIYVSPSSAPPLARVSSLFAFVALSFGSFLRFAS